MFHKMWRTVSFSRRNLLWNYLEVYLTKHRAQKDAEAAGSCSSSPHVYEQFIITGKICVYWWV